MVEEKMEQWDEGGVKVGELKEEVEVVVEVEWMVVKLGVVVVWMVEARREEVPGIVAVSC